MNVVAVILAGGQGERLSVLSVKRAKPAVPFGGKYRIIDFALSNCVNSGIYHAAVLTQYRPHSLHDHIGVGKPWDLDRARGGIRLLQPYLGRRESDWYKGTADAVFQNLPMLADWKSDLMLILSGDHIYKMDYRRMIDFHRKHQADVTVGVMEVPIEEAHRFGTLIVDDRGQVVEFDEKPAKPRSTLISMGIYVFNPEILADRLTEDSRTRGSAHDFGRDVIPKMVGQDRVFAYPFTDYWRDVGTIASYWEANMGLLSEPPDFDLYDNDWIIHTRSEERPPAKISGCARVANSLISHGCTILGTVEHSVLSPGVFVAEGAVVRDSILMTDTIVGRNATVDCAILDKEVVVGAGAHVGTGEDRTPNKLEAKNLSTGITVIGKRVRIPPSLTLGRNVRVDADVVEADFEHVVHVDGAIPSGETVLAPSRREAQRPRARTA
ncbi:MAG: glucose-1-phosphate adenylyltransferase [Chloroflexi bacterium]|nr:glucose-1-phosphate adenylyltransferase [Chloroflexota bacterium]